MFGGGGWKGEVGGTQQIRKQRERKEERKGKEWTGLRGENAATHSSWVAMAMERSKQERKEERERRVKKGEEGEWGKNTS